MKSSYVVRATNFLHRIYPVIENYMNEPDAVKSVIRVYNRKNKRAVKVCNGATRCVLITSDYVIKWDYSERWCKRFGGCKQELNMYDVARREGYAHLLAEITAVTYRGKLFVIMPRFKITENKPEIQGLISDDDYIWLCRHIDDVHENNYAVVDGLPVIIDYACKVS